MIKLKKLLKESSPGFTKNEANASVIRKKLLKKFGEDPLYREFILAKTPKEQKKALKTLKSIRGGNAVRLMQKYVKKLQDESVNEISGVDLAKKVLKNKSYEKGIDLQTANLIVTIDKAYDKNPALQKKFRAIPLAKMKQLVMKYYG